MKIHRITSSSTAKTTEKDVIGKKPFILVATAVWCGHCQMFKPEWEKAKRELKKEGFDIDIIEVDDDARTLVMSENPFGPLSGILRQITGYPTLVSFKQRGKATSFEMGERSKENLLKFVKKQSSRPKTSTRIPSQGQTIRQASKAPSKSKRPVSVRDKGIRRHQ